MEGERAETLLHGPVLAWGLVGVQAGVGRVPVTQKPGALAAAAAARAPPFLPPPFPRDAPVLQHLLQQVLPIRGPLGRDVLPTHVPQLARWVGLHGLASTALLTGPCQDAGLLGGGRGGAQGLYWEAMGLHGRQSTGSNLAGAQDWRGLRLWAPQALLSSRFCWFRISPLQGASSGVGTPDDRTMLS